MDRVQHASSEAYSMARRSTVIVFLIAALGLGVACLASRTSVAAIYTYTPTNSTTDQWSAGTNWSGIPVGGITTELTFVGDNATVLSDGLTNTNIDDLGGPFSLNILNLQGTGPASGAATVNISSSSASNYLNFVSNDSVTPVVNLNAMAGVAGLRYIVSTSMALVDNTVFQGDGTARFGFTGAIRGDGGLVKTGTSTLLLGGNNTYGGLTSIRGGTLSLGNTNALSNSTLDYNGYGGTLDFYSVSAASLGGLQGEQSLALRNLFSQAVALTVGTNNSSTTYSGVLSGSGRLIKQGTGALTLAGASTYSGSTTVNAGRVQLGCDSLGSVGSITSSPVGIGTLVLSGGCVCASDDTTSRTLYNPVTIGGDSALGDIVNIGPVALAGPVTLTNGNRVLTVAGTVAINGAINDGGHSYGLTKAGTGVLLLAGGNTYSGTTTISSGLLDLEDSNTLQNSTVNIGVTNGLGFGHGIRTFTLGGLAGSGDLNLANHGGDSVTLWVGNSNQSTSYEGVLSGAGSLVKVGTGTLVLTGASGHAGGTTISNGTVSFANKALDATGGIVFDGGTLQWNGANTQDISGLIAPVATGQAAIVDTNGNSVSFASAIVGSGGLTKTGAGTLSLAVPVAYTGNTKISAGTLSFGAGALDSSNAICFDGGALQWRDSNIQDISNRIAPMAGGKSAVLDTNGNHVSFASGLSGSGGLTKAGTGTLTLADTNTYSGDTAISGGTLLLTSDETLQNSTLTLSRNGGIVSLGTLHRVVLGGLSGDGDMSLANAAGEEVALTVGANNKNTVYSGRLIGGGSFTKTGTGDLGLTASCPDFTGDTRIASGTLWLCETLGSFALRSSTVDMNANDTGTLAVDYTASSAYLGGLKGSRPLTIQKPLYVGLNNQDTTYSGVLNGSGNLVKQGTGTLTFTNTNTYTGRTSINSGALNIGSGAGLPTGSKLCFSGYDADTPVVETSANFVGQVGPKVFWYASGGFAAKGAPIQVQLTSHDGGDGLAWGKLYFVPTGSSLVLNSPGADNVVDFQNAIDFGSADRSVYVADNVGATTDYAILSGALSGLGGLIKGGPGLLVLSGNNTYSGSTSANAGTLALGVNNALPDATDVILNGATLATNGFSQTDALGELTIGAHSVIDVGLTGGSILRFADSHANSWVGTLTIAHWNGLFDGGGADELLFGSSDSALATSQLSCIVFENPNGLAGDFRARILATGEVVPVSIPGDTNDDGRVDAADATTLAAHWGQAGGRADGDFNGDGVISAADASILAANWGHGIGETGAVPEPGIAAMLLIGASMLLLRRSR